MKPSYLMTGTIKSLKEGMGDFMRVAVAVAVACFGLVSITQGEDADAAIRRPTDIPAQTPRPALQQLSKDRDLQLIFRTDVVGELQTNGASGELTFDEALSQLLTGTGLTYRYLDDKTVTILRLPSGGGKLVDPKAKDAGGKVSGAAGTTSPKAPEAQKSASFWDRFRLAQVDQGNAGGGAVEKPGAAPAGNSLVTLEEIIVTAQKREERLSETPLSITAISSQTLASLGATQFRDIANTVPSLNFTTAGVGQTQVNLRGITTGGNVSPTVGIYVDEVPYGSSTPFAAGAQLALDVGLFDLSRVEVLRGPQGTLYERAPWVASSNT